SLNLLTAATQTRTQDRHIFVGGPSILTAEGLSKTSDYKFKKVIALAPDFAKNLAFWLTPAGAANMMVKVGEGFDSRSVDQLMSAFERHLDDDYQTHQSPRVVALPTFAKQVLLDAA